MTERPGTEPTSERPRLRADAAENRRRILDAARALYRERGADVPLDVIARRAGVGNATLYRRFPTADALLAAVLEERLAELVSVTEEALLIPDPWDGFCWYVQRVGEMQATDRSLADLRTMSASAAPGVGMQWSLFTTALVDLIHRAQAGGQLRADLQVEDVLVLMMANAGVTQSAGEAGPAIMRRFLSLVLDGCRARGAESLPNMPAPDQVFRAARDSPSSAQG